MIKHSATTAVLIMVLASCGHSSPPALVDGMLQLDDGNINSTIESSSGYLLVHFTSYDSNCGYCVDSNGFIREVLKEYANAPQFARIHWEPWHKGAEISPKVYKEYWIRGLPMLVLYNNGKEEWRGTGYTDALYTELAQQLESCCQ